MENNLHPSDRGQISELIGELRYLIRTARQAVTRSVDTIQVLTYFEIGRRIVEYEQQGEKRAEYGKGLLKRLSSELAAEFGRGFSHRNLDYMRKFYLTYQNRSTQISQTLFAKSLTSSKSQTVSDESSHTAATLQISQTPFAKFVSPFKLSWAHYVFLMGVKDADERSFYEIEADEQGWSLRKLKRQFASGLYERLALSRDKDGIRQLANEGQIVTRPEDLLKEPYVLEFLGLEEKDRYTESDLETAIIDKLEHFLLELGKGFLFEARQKRFTFDEEHFFVDLVFYNRLLRCYVLLDLKIGKLTHQDLGQMQTYVNYFDRYSRLQVKPRRLGLFCANARTTHWWKSPCRRMPISTPANIGCICRARTNFGRN